MPGRRATRCASSWAAPRFQTSRPSRIGSKSPDGRRWSPAGSGNRAAATSSPTRAISRASLGAGSATRAQAAGPVTDDDMREAHALIASPKEPNMPIPAIVGALLPVLSSAVPEIAKLIKPDSQAAEKNAAVAAKAFEVAQTALGAVNAQEVAERIQSDPAAAQVVRQAVQERWYELAEVGGGIQAAREADTASAIAGLRAWHSPSFWALLLLMPLVYMLVGSISGLWGYDQWSDDVRAAISTAVVSLVVGGAAGYYWGSTTTRNKLGAQS